MLWSLDLSSALCVFAELFALPVPAEADLALTYCEKKPEPLFLQPSELGPRSVCWWHSTALLSSCWRQGERSSQNC